ncbi:hypothetical protein B5C34_02270 [Pacificimonas flava]|uniref:Cytoskeleton protein RodZ-like C-terminal domain-containing protein n=2 Tax=Pacificimonas TaxID=1960290 RepID=A0A219B2N6_9SPHN|nr:MULTISPECIES: RodZ domain-containing protein [Pacificimonas]MBZ6377954.1 helix-turn-helix domain-containing protein [Pacificimonas aurantium]OWV32393.1 hypothetical protein B5C34_02270 [Pacificimonas flava]
MQEEDTAAGTMEDAPAHPPARQPEHIGAILQEARLEQGRELSDIANLTRIPVRHLAAIESGDHSSLPAIPYSIGFVKNYAREVGIDPDQAAAQFRAETTLTVREPVEININPIDERRVPPKSAVFLGLGLLAIVVIVALLWAAGIFGGPNDVADPEFDPLSDPTEVASEIGTSPPELTAPQEPEAADGEQSASLSGQVVIRADEDAWVRIRGGGETLLMRIMTAGETFEVPEGRDDLQLRTGRAGALTILVGGEELPRLGGNDEVVGEVPLTPAGLQDYVSSLDEDDAGEEG